MCMELIVFAYKVTQTNEGMVAALIASFASINISAKSGCRHQF